MKFNKYYQDELAYLRDLGREFAAENPSLAPYLSGESNDPEVERLLEGFAFLTGRLRQKLDDEFPEFSHSLIQLTLPQFLKPVPAATIIEFTPIVSAVSGNDVIPKGTVVESGPVDGTNCPFQTTTNVQLRCARIQDVRIENMRRSGRLLVHMELDPVALEQANWSGIRFYLAGTKGTSLSRSLYKALLTETKAVVLSDGSGQKVNLHKKHITPAGLSAEESLIPTSYGGFEGYTLMQEYFSFPNKFLFVDLELPKNLGLTGKSLSIEFLLEGPFELANTISRESIRINCTPAINLFPHQGDPILANERTTEYRLTARSNNGNQLNIFSVEQVTGWRQGEGRGVKYPRFESFRSLNTGGDKTYYSIRRRPPVVGNNTEHYLAFTKDDGKEINLQVETISTNLICTNGKMAAQIPIGDISHATGNSPSFATFKNIREVSPEIPPPLHKDLLWPLILTASQHLGSLLSADALKTLIAANYQRAFYDHQDKRRLDLIYEGLLDVEGVNLDWMIKGVPRRGTEIAIKVEESKFGGAGELYLFGNVLNQFLDLYANINSVHRLRIMGAEQQLELLWPIRGGERQSL